MPSSYTLATLNPTLKKDEQLSTWLVFQKLLQELKTAKLGFKQCDLAVFMTNATPPQRKIVREALEARDKLIYTNQALVLKLAEQYCNEGIAKEELIQQGNLGLMRALVKFTPDRGTKFSSYAYFWVKALIFESLYRVNPIYIPPLVRKELQQSYGYISLEEEDRCKEMASDEQDTCSSVNEILRQLTPAEQDLLTSHFNLDGGSGDLAIALKLGCSVEEARTQLEAVSYTHLTLPTIYSV